MVLLFTPNFSFAITPDYIPLEYIESTDSVNDLIDTHYILNPNRNKVMCKVDIIGDGVRNILRAGEWQQNLYQVARNNENKISAMYYTNSVPAQFVTEETYTNPIEINFNKNVLIINGNEVNTFTNTPLVPATSLRLLEQQVPYNINITTNVYYLKIYDNDTLVQNMIPAKRKSDGAIGMYDTVSGNFFENAGTGTFTAGPELYTFLDYIESTGTQIIYTGAYAQTGSIVEVDYQITSDRPSGEYEWQAIYSSGSGGAGWPGHMFGFLLTLRTKRYSVYYEGITDVYDSAIDTNRHIVRQESEKFYIDGNLLYTRPTANFTNSSPVMLFNRAGENLYMMGRIYSAKIWSDGTNLSFNGIPAKRKSDGAIGMYDTVTNTFFENAGTGTFTAGPEVPTTSPEVPTCPDYANGVPVGYKVLDHIKSTGTQYIDTGVYSDKNTEIELIAKTNNAATWGFIYGADVLNANQSYHLGQTGVDYTLVFDFIEAVIDSSHRIKSSVLGADSFHKIEVKNQSFIVDETTFGNFASENNFTPTYSSWLFRINNQDGRTDSGSSIEYCKIWQSGTLVRNFVPVQRISDNEVGMYDTVNHKFYTNDGTGAFTAGSVIDACEPTTFVCTSDANMNIFGDDMCMIDTPQPTWPYLTAWYNAHKYYIKLSENDYPIHSGSSHKLQIITNGTTYNAHDESVTE